jgi:hypothetical protein
MFSGRFVAPTWDQYSSFAQIWLIAHEEIQDLYSITPSPAASSDPHFKILNNAIHF